MLKRVITAPAAVRRLVRRRRGTTPDYRGIPTHECVCGCDTFRIVARFDEYDIALWFTDGECTACGALLTVPTPADDPANRGVGS